MTTNDPNDGASVQSDYLRLVIREAVEREVAAQVASIKQQQQINLGELRTINQTIGALTGRLDDINAIVRGDEALGIKGLIKTVDEIGVRLAEYSKQLDDQSDKLRDLGIYVRVGFAVLIALGLFDNDRIIGFLGSILRSAGIGL